MFKKTIFMAIAATALLASPAFADGDGAKVFKKKCKACHAIKAGKNKSGPSLAGIFGKKAGEVKGYKKYKGLKGSSLVWDEKNLDGWLKNPKKFIGKSTSMSAKLKKEDDRKAIIEYLKGI
ncbi:MAG: c-type cytochrome [Rhodospirillaceae bacterium]|nr:c-type cytochrome [Rhodospirillaceae bacterium]